MAKKKIIMERYGEHGWMFSILNTGINEYEHFRTNKNGEGCWIVNKNKPDQQIMGTNEFELSATYKNAYAKLHRRNFEYRPYPYRHFAP